MTRRLARFTAQIISLVVVIVVAGWLLGLVLFALIGPSPTTGHGDASAPSLETRTAEAYARLALQAHPGVSAGDPAFHPAGDGGVPSLPSSAQLMLPVLEAGNATRADGSGIRSAFPGVGSPAPSAASLDLADWALPTPLVGFGGLHPIQETWYRGWAAGIASWMPEWYGSGYLALPIGPGYRVRICGAGGCAEMVSVDAGPALHMQRPPYNRVADIAVVVWERITGLPRRLGLAQISVAILGRSGR